MLLAKRTRITTFIRTVTKVGLARLLPKITPMNYPLVKPKYYASLFKDILIFIKKPKNDIDIQKSIRMKIYDTIGLFILKLIFLIPVLLFFALIYDPENIQSTRMAQRFSPFALLLVGGMILPLVEEVAFRLSLIFNSSYLSLSSGALLYYFLTKAIFHTKMSAVDDSFVTRVSLALAFGFFIYLILNIKTVNKKVAAFWSRHFQSIFYLSSLIFAWIHINKYELIWINILLLPIITLPQLLSAIIYGYTRVLFGFGYPLTLHMTMNSVAIGLSLLGASNLISI